MGEPSRGDDDNTLSSTNKNISGERSEDNNPTASTQNETTGKPHLEYDNVPPDRTTGKAEEDGNNNHNKRPIGNITTGDDDDRPQASSSQGSPPCNRTNKDNNTASIAKTTGDDDRPHASSSQGSPPCNRTTKDNTASIAKTTGDDDRPHASSSQGSPPCNRTTKDNTSSLAKTTENQLDDKCKNKDRPPPDKNTTEGDNTPLQTNDDLTCIQDNVPLTQSKTTEHKEDNNWNTQLLENDSKSPPSNASLSHNKSEGRPSSGNNDASQTPRKTSQQQLVRIENNPTTPCDASLSLNKSERHPSTDNASTSSALPPDRTNSSQTPRKTSQQQLVKNENNPTTPSPRKKKKQSQAHQLRTNTGTNIKRHRLQHKHSLDENNQALSDSEEDNYSDSDSESDSGATNICHNSSYEYYTPADGQSLPEYVGHDENAPEIFKAPRRAAVHPNRPPFHELRPHPLRETQVGKFLRTIESTDTQLWAGQECGVRVWKLSDSYAPGIGIGGRARRGDEEASPFYESVNTSPTMCLTIDCGSKLVWSGHKDGKIRSWNMEDDDLNDDPFPEGLSWEAHRGPVLTMVISSYGDLWSGSEGGAIHVWPWEAINKSLSLKIEERHMASLLVERSFINLRSQVTLNGVRNISSQDLKVLLCDTVVAKVWACGTSSISLWDARTRELLKVYNVDGHIENRADMPSVQDQSVEDEMNVKVVSKSKKEKPRGFLQRSRNAIMGAAGAVRRAASKSGQEESKLKIEAVVVASNGMIYSGCSNGLIVQWDGNGTRLQEFNHHPCAVLCFCTYGSRIWVGYVSGMVQVLDLDGNLIAGWVAHNGPVIKLVVGNGHFFSLATHGGIRGWSIASPGPIDQIIRSEISKKELSYTRRENVKILVGTWNVGQGKSSHDALMAWVGSAVSDVSIVIVGLQEVEMGAGFLAMSAAKETVGLEGSSIGHWWQDAIGKALDEGSTFERVGSRQLAGLLIAIWVRTSIRTYVGDLDAGAVACGLGRKIGNKGGVGLRLRVYDRIMCFVNCHFAAHLEAVNRRNADFSHIYRTMDFSRSSNLLSNASAGVSSAAQGVRGTNTVESNPAKEKPDLAEADLVLFCGDLNYRLFGISYDDARDLVSQRSFDWLRERDQLRAEMEAGKVFQGMREAIVKFPPTYKFDKGKPGLGGYDSGEKKRIPAWCDRVLYRDNRSSSTLECSLECPVVASILQYEACMDVLESDHKPVRCQLTVEIANVDRSIRRQEMGKIINSHDAISSLRNEQCAIPKTDISINSIVLQSQETGSFKITNKSATDKAVFQIICEGQATIQVVERELVYSPRGAFGFLRWLEVIPASGVVGPDQVADILVRHEDFDTTEQFVEGVPQTWWSEDTCDKEVLLKVIVRGNCSSETSSHTVHVRHCYSCKATQTDSSKGSGSGKYQGNTYHRSGVRHGSSQSDFDENKSLRGSKKDLKS